MNNFSIYQSYRLLRWVVCLIAILIMIGVGCVAQPPEPTPPPTPSPEPEPANNEPVINYMTAPEEITPSSEAEIHCVVTDKDKDTLTYSWSVPVGTLNGEGDIVTWTAPDEPGVYTIEVSVSDGNGGEVTDSILIKVANKPNQLPTVALWVWPDDKDKAFEANEDPIKVKREAIIEIECIAEDPDGDDLKYAWAASAGRVVGEGNKVNYYTLTTKGNQYVTVTVTDSKDGQVQRSVYFDVPCCGSQ